MNNHLTDSELLNRYLQKCAIYGEYGAGDSTVFASHMSRIQEIHSVESDKSWIEHMRGRLTRPVTFYYKEMDTKHMDWGHPGPNATEAQKRAYSDPIPAALDLVLIDGRFRVATALKLHQAISDATIVAFDDFLIRKHYHLVLDYYKVLDEGKTMVILQRDPAKVPPMELIRQYELIAD